MKCRLACRLVAWSACHLVILLALLLAPSPALPCSICPLGPQNTATLRQELAQDNMVFYGTLANSKLNPAGGGTVDVQIEAVLKNDPFLANKKVVQVGRYVPVDPRNPPRYLLFCNSSNGRLDLVKGIEVKSAAIVDYLRGATAIDPQDRNAVLLYCFRYLDHADPEVSADAFLEFAKASDQEVGQLARRLDPVKLRRLLTDPQAPPSRLSLYAFLLGACGGDAEASLLRAMIEKPSDKQRSALNGLLAGYIELRPREGWALTQAMLGEFRRPFIERNSVVQTLRFYHAWKGALARREILAGLAVLLPQGDIADVAIEDLRKYQWWDLTREVLAQNGKKSHSAPLMRRVIVRYALCCPRPEAVDFIKELRKAEPALVKDVEESLQFEQMK